MRTTLSLAIVLLAPLSLRAEDVAAQMNAKSNELNGVKRQIQALDQDAGSAITAEKARLSDTADLLKGAENNLSKKYDDLARRAQNEYAAPLQKHNGWVDDHTNRVQNHDSRCGGTYDNVSYVNACNAEADRLDAEGAQIRQETQALKAIQSRFFTEKKDIDDYAAGLKQRREDLNNATLAWAAKVTSYNAKRNDLVASYNKILAELQALGNQYGECVKGLPSTWSDEKIKHRCGNIQFDNVRKSLKELSNIRPEFAATPN